MGVAYQFSQLAKLRGSTAMAFVLDEIAKRKAQAQIRKRWN